MSSEILVDDVIQVVSFTVSEKTAKKGNYAISIDQVKEIRTVDAITKIPKSKTYVKGLMNLRGKIIPIIDVSEKIGWAKTSLIDTSKQRILVTDVNDTLTGLLVDEVNDVIKIPTKEIESVEFGTLETNRYIRGIAKTKDNLIVLLDVSKFLRDSPNNFEQAEINSNLETKIEYNVKNTENTLTENYEILPEIDELIKQEMQSQ